MRVSVVQMNPGANKDDNIAQARALLDQAISADHPNIVSLPEVWDSLGGDRGSPGHWEPAGVSLGDCLVHPSRDFVAVSIADAETGSGV